MPVIQCAKCQAKLNVPDTSVGKKVKCPKCQTIFAVPGGTAITAQPKPAGAAPAAAPQPQAARSPASKGNKPPQPKRKKGSPVLLILGVLGLLAFCCVGSAAVGGFYLWTTLKSKVNDTLAKLPKAVNDAGKVERPDPNGGKKTNPNDQNGGKKKTNPNDQNGGKKKTNPNDQNGGKKKTNPNDQNGGNKKTNPSSEKAEEAPTLWAANLKPGQSQTKLVQFQGSRPAVIDVTVNEIGGKRPDVELEVSDMSNQVVASDNLDGSTRFATFVPASTQTYRVVLRNRGKTQAQCVINAR